MAFVRKRGKSWYVYWRSDGEQRAKSFGTDKQAALKYEALKTADEIRGVRDPSRTSWFEFWQRYKEEKLPRLTEKSQGTYATVGERVLVPYFGTQQLAIRRTTVREWMAWAEQHAGPGTVQKAFTILSSIMGYALDLDMIPANPCSGMGKYLPQVTSPRVRPHLSPEKVAELADEVHHDFRAVVLAMAVLGLRPGEAVALRVGDIDVEKATVHVHRSAVDVPGKGMVERSTTKTGSSRVIPSMGVERAFKDHLRWKYRPLDGTGPARIPNGGDLLFESPVRGVDGMINAPALAKLVREAGTRIGVAGLSADDLRHTAYANLIELTGDVSFAQRVLGHASPHMGLIHYDTITPVRYASAIEAVRQRYAG